MRYMKCFVDHNRGKKLLYKTPTITEAILYAIVYSMKKIVRPISHQAI